MDKISIVTSLYKSESYIEEFYQRHVACLEQMGVEFEFVFVNDGSPDDSRTLAKRLAEIESNVIFVDLSRNFGQHAAMFAAMSYASGNLICALDSDLEEDPENVVEMYRILKSTPDVDVVYGVLKTRSGGFVRDWLGQVFYFLLDLFSTVKIPRDQAWQRLMTADYVRALLSFPESQTLPAGLMVLAGFKQVPYLLEKRYKGTSSYSFRGRLLLAVNSLVSFSSRPLIAICCVGMIVTVLSGLAIFGIVVAKLLGRNFQMGWSSLIASIWCIGGLNLFSIGVVGLYLARVFNQVKNRPLFVVRSVVGLPQGKALKNPRGPC